MLNYLDLDLDVGSGANLSLPTVKKEPKHCSYMYISSQTRPRIVESNRPVAQEHEKREPDGCIKSLDPSWTPAKESITQLSLIL